MYLLSLHADKSRLILKSLSLGEKKKIHRDAEESNLKQTSVLKISGALILS